MDDTVFPATKDHWVRRGGRADLLSLRDLISLGRDYVQVACNKISELSKVSLQNLFRPEYGEMMSPFELSCYYGNVTVLNCILRLTTDFKKSPLQINAAFSHAIWHNHPMVLSILLDHFSYTFDAGEYQRVRLIMRDCEPLKNKMNHLNQRDFDYAKSLSLLSSGALEHQNMVPYICAFLPTVHEGRGTEILHALRHFNSKLNAQGHEEQLQACLLKQLSLKKLSQ